MEINDIVYFSWSRKKQLGKLVGEVQIEGLPYYCVEIRRSVLPNEIQLFDIRGTGLEPLFPTIIFLQGMCYFIITPDTTIRLVEEHELLAVMISDYL